MPSTSAPEHRAVGVGHRYTDLDDLVGTWADDAEFSRAVAAMDRVDNELWK